MVKKKFEQAVAEDIILTKIVNAVKKAMNYVPDTQSARKLKTPPRVKFLSISHFSGVQREYVAYFGMLTEKQGMLRDVRVPEGLLIVEAQVGSGTGG